jgi:hypothetical protein
LAKSWANKTFTGTGVTYDHQNIIKVQPQVAAWFSGITEMLKSQARS